LGLLLVILQGGLAFAVQLVLGGGGLAGTNVLAMSERLRVLAVLDLQLLLGQPFLGIGVEGADLRQGVGIDVAVVGDPGFQLRQSVARLGGCLVGATLLHPCTEHIHHPGDALQRIGNGGRLQRRRLGIQGSLLPCLQRLDGQRLVGVAITAGGGLEDVGH